MSTVWTEVDINRFSQEAEDAFLVATNCIITRWSLNIIANLNEYVLPDYVISIRRVTWKGQKLDPLPLRSLRNVGYPLSVTGRPSHYIYNNVGASKIVFFPTPNETILPSVENVTKLWSTEIENCVIVEFARTSDYTNFRIPHYIRRRLIKSYVMMKCFSMENRGQNIKVSKYFINKWKLLSEVYGNLMQELISKPRKIVLTGGWEYARFGINYHPNWNRNLPINRYGIGVDPGE